MLPFLVLLIFLVFIVQSRGIGVFYQQLRVGMNGNRFALYKFKTMKDSSREMKLSSAGVVKVKNDNRITKFGGFMRSFGLDEMPQILNVFIGEMSWVGPRPIVEQEHDHLSIKEKERVSVLPGITGLAQINGRAALDLSTVASYDLQYIRNYSSVLDIKIIFNSVPIVLFRENSF